MMQPQAILFPQAVYDIPSGIFLSVKIRLMTGGYNIKTAPDVGPFLKKTECSIEKYTTSCRLVNKKVVPVTWRMPP
jgi:hypothetical protein